MLRRGHLASLLVAVVGFVGACEPELSSDGDFPTYGEAEPPAGSPVAFHLHNHGVNNYRLVELTVSPRL